MIEVVVNHGRRGDLRLARETLGRILSLDPHRAGQDPVILVLVCRKAARAVTAWASQDGSGQIAQAWPRDDLPEGPPGRAKNRPAPRKIVPPA
jgi:hypothetical protein